MQGNGIQNKACFMPIMFHFSKVKLFQFTVTVLPHRAQTFLQMVYHFIELRKFMKLDKRCLFIYELNLSVPYGCFSCRPFGLHMYIPTEIPLVFKNLYFVFKKGSHCFNSKYKTYENEHYVLKDFVYFIEVSRRRERGESLRVVPAVVHHQIPQSQIATQVHPQAALQETEKRTIISQSNQDLEMIEVGSPHV